MKKQFFSFLLLLSFVFSASAQKTQVAKTKAEATDKNLRTHVEYLASDKLEGRRTGETGATYAAGYVANMFSNFKLKAVASQASNGKTNANYLQTFSIVTGVEMAKEGNSFSVDVSKADNQKMTFSDEMAFKPVGFSPNAAIGDTEVVFVGYGIASSEHKYDDYKDKNINGKIVLAFDGTPDNDNPHSPFARFDARAKALIAKEKGAIALLLITREAKLEDDKLAQLKYDQTNGEAALPTMLVSRKTAADIIGADEARLKSEEQKLIATTKGAVGGTISDKPLSSKAIVSLKINLIKKQAEAYNVVGILEGNDPILKNEAIVVGAHYDHLGRGGQGSLAVNSTEIHHGADDNASGVSALIELAQQFSSERKNKRTIIFIAFGGEEEGLLGSQFYVKNPAFPLDKTVAMINMDMIGRLKDDKLTVGGIGTASEWRSLVEKFNPQYSLKIPTTTNENIRLKNQIISELTKAGLNRGINVEIAENILYLSGVAGNGRVGDVVRISQQTAKILTKEYIIESPNPVPTNAEIASSIPFVLQLSEDGFGPSDHSSFYAQKIPVLFFFTGTHADYHKPSDTAEKINYEGLNKVMNFVAEIVKAVDGNPKRPTYTVAKSSGMGGGRSGFKVSLGTVPNYADGAGDGLLLDGVRDDSPAAKAGIKAGDKITKLAGRDVRNVNDYTFVLGELKAGVEYEVEIVRGSEKLKLKIIPAARK
jgi:Zn-dependent M28 family amino/carboxypeptidase